jgi:ABC-type polysaccharide/polyol phosphate export permease
MDSPAYMLRTGRRGTLFEFRMAWRDLAASMGKFGLSWSLAWHDVRSRYRGSILGPFWITLSMGLMVLGIGFLYARLFAIPLQEFLPFVAIGIVTFGVISGVVNEGCDTFVAASGMLSQTSLPMFTFVWRTLLRNLINFAHHLVIIVAVLVVYGYWRTAHAPEAVLGALLLVLNVSWMSLLAGIASSRFRDIPPVVTSAIQFAMFMTPVFWRPDRMGQHHLVLTLNPFFHMLDAVRAPLLGVAVAPLSYLVLSVMALVGWTLAFSLFAVTRRRIVHYL